MLLLHSLFAPSSFAVGRANYCITQLCNQEVTVNSGRITLIEPLVYLCMQTLLVALPHEHEVSLLNHTPMTTTLWYLFRLCNFLVTVANQKKSTVYIDMLQYINLTIPTTRVTIMTNELHLVLVHV